MLLRPLDTAALHARFVAAHPFPHVVLEDLLEPEFAGQLVRSLPAYEDSLRTGFQFETVNEHRKVQLTDRARFPEPVARLLDAFHSPEWLETLSRLTGIPSLLVDERLFGGGLHQTAKGGRLDVHADFNFIPDVQYFRRLNLLLYLNPVWEESWGGALELWDENVEHCGVRVLPTLGRCVIFETSTKSFHGTTRVSSPRGVTRSSFALYYYTREAPPNFDDQFQGTVFRARPNERFKGKVLMPLERRWNVVSWKVGSLWRKLRGAPPARHRGLRE